MARTYPRPDETRVPYTTMSWLVSRPLWWTPSVFLPATLLLPGGSVLWYARYVERWRIRVRPVDLTLPGWPRSARTTVVHLSDLHMVGDDRWARHVVRAVDRAGVSEHAVGVITGDFLYRGARPSEVARVLRGLPRPRGGWFVVRGGWENSCDVVGERFEAFCEEAELTPLVNDSATIELAGQRLNLVGLDDPEGGHPDLAAALVGADPAAPNVVLVHRPDLFDSVAGEADLVLAGHSHGGQVRLPGLGPLWLPQGCRRYNDGVYRRNGTTLSVNRGVGTTLAPLRLMCPPEIALVRLQGAGRSDRYRPARRDRGDR